MKIKGVIEDLKISFKFKKKERMIIKIVKIYLGLSLVLWVLWGQFIFSYFLGPAYISQYI